MRDPWWWVSCSHCGAAGMIRGNRAPDHCQRAMNFEREATEDEIDNFLNGPDYL